MSKFLLSAKAKSDLIKIAKYTQSTWGQAQRNDYLKLLDYCNREFRIISANYSCMVPQIKLNEKYGLHHQNDFNIISQKFTSKETEIKNEKVQVTNNNNNEASCSYH